MKGNAIPAENSPEQQCIGHPKTVYFLQLLLQGASKYAEIVAKIAKNTRFEIPPFVLPKIGSGEKFNMDAQLQFA